MKNSDFSDLCSGDRCITINASSDDRNNSYPSDNRNNDKDYGNYSGSQSFSGDGNYSSGTSLTQEQQAIVFRYQNITKGFTGQVLGGAYHGLIKYRDYEEKPFVNREMLHAVRKLDNDSNPKAINFILFYGHYLNDDDMYWLSSMFNSHKDLAVNTVDLSNNCLRLAKDNGLPFFSFNSSYNTPRNIGRLDLSDNNICDTQEQKLLLMR